MSFSYLIRNSRYRRSAFVALPAAVLLVNVIFTLRSTVYEESSAHGHEFRRGLLANDHLKPVKTDGGTNPLFFEDAAIVVLLVCTAGMMAGLTIGMLSVEPLELEIYIHGGGTEQQKKWAQTLWPVINTGHRLLVTLLLVNSTANEALPIFMDRLVDWRSAIVLSVTLVLLFGEILPSAVFTGKQKLMLSASLVPVVQCLLFIMYPVAWPLGKMLDCIMGDSHGSASRFNRQQLQTMVRLHQVREFKKVAEEQHVGEFQHHGGDGGYEGDGDRDLEKSGLLLDEVNIISHALSLGTRMVKDVMTPLKEVKMVSADSRLNAHTIAFLVGMGHSRIPVYEGDTSNIRGFLILKKLLVVDHSVAPLVSSLTLRQPLAVNPTTNLIDMLNEFQIGRSHVAVVVENPVEVTARWNSGEPLENDQVLGIITCEDVLEELIGEEIEDEDDYDRRNPIMKKLMPAATTPMAFATFQKGQSLASNASETTLAPEDALALNLQHPAIKSMLVQNAANKLIREVEKAEQVTVDVSVDEMVLTASDVETAAAEELIAAAEVQRFMTGDASRRATLTGTSQRSTPSQPSSAGSDPSQIVRPRGRE